MTKRILVVDIGNTSTSVGIYSSGRVQHVARLERTLQKPERIRKTIKNVLKDRAIKGAALCSVVPDVNKTWNREIKRLGTNHIVWVDHRIRLGVNISYPKPATIGPDRLANATAAVARFGAPVIVADFGTALTFDVVSKSKSYIGGVIAPGLPLMFSYLSDKTALLPHIEPGPVRRNVGKSTEEAMRIGAKWGYRGMVKEILERLRMDLGQEDIPVCATGGFAAWVLRGLDDSVVIDPKLTLVGLGQIYELNQQ